MAPRSNVDERLQRLRGVRDEGDRDKVRDLCAKALTDSSNLVIAEAAKLIGEYEFSESIPLLLATFKRLAEHADTAKVDRCCTAKVAIIETLARLSYDEPDFYLSAIRYAQIEPAWPTEEDTAENVRGGAALALARSQRIRAVDKLNVFVDLLYRSRFPKSRADRINAIRAMADTGSESAIPLLRFKLRSGDEEAEVIGLCMSGLLELAPSSSIPFVIACLKDPNEDVVLEAAAALGVCGKPEAVAALIATWNRTGNPETRRSLLLSIGLSRDKTATDFLISRLESKEDSEDVLEALKPSCVYHETQTRIREILRNFDDKTLQTTFERKFGRGE